MRWFLVIIFLLIILMFQFGCKDKVDSQKSDTAQQKKSEESIGEATMQEDGTIILRLRAESEEGVIGEAQLTYPPSHPQYAEILSHLGGLKPGESKPVPPWED